MYAMPPPIKAAIKGFPTLAIHPLSHAVFDKVVLMTASAFNT
jgi:hypothetical protein